MRRYLLVLVTIAVVLSLALVGCVGAPAGGGDQGGGDQGGGDQGGTTPPSPFVPKPAHKDAFLVKSEVKFEWKGWEVPKGFVILGYNFYLKHTGEGTNSCATPTTWGDPESVNACCPWIEKVVDKCGCYWWKVEACGTLNGEATTITVTGPWMICVGSGFLVEVKAGETSLASGVVLPNKPTLDLELGACDLSLPASIIIYTVEASNNMRGWVIAETICATTDYAISLTPDASKNWNFTLTGSAIGTLKPATTVSVDLGATPAVCTGAFGNEIVKITLTVFPDIPGDGCCPGSVHCCKKEYTVNIKLEGEAPSLELWSSCTDCGGPCECGWLVLKMPKCFTLAATQTARTPDATVTIYDGTRFIEIGVAELESATHTDHKIIGDYRYYFRCLDGMDPVGIQKITEGKSYNIKVNKGAFKFTNSASPAVTFGWPCADATETVTAK